MPHPFEVDKNDMNVIDNTKIESSGSALYRIVVQGTVDKEWSERLGGMDITSISQASGVPQTELRGFVRDQAELSGILETLYELHLPILKVEHADEN